MNKLLTICLIFITIQTLGQKLYTELYGFKIGQYRETTTNEFGKPFQSGKYEDGFEYEIFLLKPDTSLFIAFEYAADKTDVIWSIQVSGFNTTTETGFEKIKLGIDKSQVEKFFGEPSSKEDIGKYGFLWSYDNSNFTFEINPKGNLSSIKIRDNSNDLFENQELRKIPPFDKIQRTLNSADKAEIIKLLAPDIEIYANDSIYFFKKSVKTEQSDDYSKIFSLIKDISSDLSTVKTNNPSEYDENTRIQPGENPLHVIKILKGHRIKEIVMKYYFGQYLIWEIKT
jgi:hypothetical protein